MTASKVHPRDALFEDGDQAPRLPVCDHYAGAEARMRKSLELQGEMGPVFDVTLDCEDGAPIGGETEHALLVAELVNSAQNQYGRVGARVHPVDHPAFEQELDTLIGRAGARLAYLMVPKPRHLADVQRACAGIDHVIRTRHPALRLPLHFLIETHGALRDIDAIAAHPRVESLSFGLMDFVSAHRGAIPAQGMSAQGQFTHPLVLRAKLEISAACHAHGKTPSHSVVTEFADKRAIGEAAEKAARELGYTRMWSIHPNQIRPIVEAFAPTAAEVDLAVEIIHAAQVADWAPIRHRDTLHDRASYRYFWHVLERAQRTGQPLPAEVREAYFRPASV
ncbi:MAG TPA: aldolase/citrate lyase family protein [Albitalea sp.]|uniref:HpcH/HpaI aldolase/citrate lyase family protein n=1 Tax=Piscinibacter sp. TaxID=1903157 RepID=UPI002ED29150